MICKYCTHHHCKFKNELCIIQTASFTVPSSELKKLAMHWKYWKEKDKIKKNYKLAMLFFSFEEEFNVYQGFSVLSKKILCRGVKF